MLIIIIELLGQTGVNTVNDQGKQEAKYQYELNSFQTFKSLVKHMPQLLLIAFTGGFKE
jgi:hypothetical protein